MYNFPSRLNSQEDYIFIKNNFSKEQWQPFWRRLIDNLYIWQIEKELEENEEGRENKVSKIQIEEDVFNKEKKVRKYQLVFKEDKNAELFRLGFTVKEVKKALNL